MIGIRRILAVGFILLGSSAACLGQNETIDFSVSDRYFKLYLAGQIDELESFLSDDFHFEDSVSNFTGKENSLSGLKNAFSWFTIERFDETRRLRSGTVTVYDGKISFEYKGEALGAPGERFHFDIPFIVAVKMREDKIVQHVDYVDMAAFNEQFARQLDEIRKTP